MLPAYEKISQQLTETDAWHHLEKKRNFYIKLRKLIWLAGAAVSASGIWLFWLFFLAKPQTPEGESEGSIYGAFLCLMIVLLGVYAIWQGSRKMHKKYSYHYKKLIVPQLVTSLIAEASSSTSLANARYSCEYKIDEGIPLAQLRAFPMFEMIRDSHKSVGEDLFVGTLGLTDFQLAEMNIWEVTEDIDTRNKVTTFTGLVFLADFHKHFEGTTVFQSRTGKASSLKTSIGSKMKSMNDSFDRLFRITTTDENTARFLLSNGMLERLIALYSKFPDKGITICLHNGRLALAIHYVDFFETNGLNRLDTGTIHNTYEEIKSVFELVDLLNLNARIGNK